MVETRSPELSGKEVRFSDDTWELTGIVNIRGSGEVLEVTGKQVDDVRHRKATLRFFLNDPPASLNPGDLGSHINTLEREGSQYFIVVEKEPRTYRYELGALEYE